MPTIEPSDRVRASHIPGADGHAYFIIVKSFPEIASVGTGSLHLAYPSPRLPGKPASLRPGVVNPLWTAFPSADYYGSSVTRGLAPRRPSRRALLQHVRA